MHFWIGKMWTMRTFFGKITNSRKNRCMQNVAALAACLVAQMQAYKTLTLKIYEFYVFMLCTMRNQGTRFDSSELVFLGIFNME